MLYFEAVVSCHFGFMFAARDALCVGHWRPVWREKRAEGERGEGFCPVGQGKGWPGRWCALPAWSLQAVSAPSSMAALSHAEGAWLMPHRSLSCCAPMVELGRGVLQPQPQAAWPSSPRAPCPSISCRDQGPAQGHEAGLGTLNSQAPFYPFSDFWCNWH